MKHKNSIFAGWQRAILVFVAVTVVLTTQGYCQTDGMAILLQQTPVDGGEITPDVGVHHFELNTEIILTAIPKPGYQFVYWLGDVSDPTANTTIVYLDSPKIVIAVFERAEYEQIFVVEERSQSAGIGGLRRTAGDYGRGGFGGAGRRKPEKRDWPRWEPPEPPEPKEFPVPEEEGKDFPVPEQADEFPVPVPEPATGVLLIVGSLFALARRRPGQRNKSDGKVFREKQK